MKLDPNPIPNVRLSDLFTDPELRRFFRDGDRDRGFPLCVPDPEGPDMGDSDALELEDAA